MLPRWQCCLASVMPSRARHPSRASTGGGRGGGFLAALGMTVLHKRCGNIWNAGFGVAQGGDDGRKGSGEETDASAGVGQRVGDLAAAVPEVERHEDGAALGGGV